jgi:hypothetical protein
VATSIVATSVAIQPDERMTNVKKRTKPAECLKFGGSGHRLVVEVLGFERLECRQLCDTQFLKTGAQPVRVRASQVRLPFINNFG